MSAVNHPLPALRVAPWFRTWLVLPLLLALAAGARAALYEVNFTGGVIVQTGPWDSSIQSGSPFHLSATFFTPPPEAYDLGGYTTYVYRSAPASMTLEVGDYVFTGGRVDFSVWNDYPYSRWDGTALVDGYLIFTDTGTSPGFDSVMFSAALQTTATGTLATKGLPTEALPLTVFDHLQEVSLNVNFSGSGAFAHLDGQIGSYTLTEVPEPAPLLLVSVAAALAVRARRRGQ